MRASHSHMYTRIRNMHACTQQRKHACSRRDLDEKVVALQREIEVQSRLKEEQERQQQPPTTSSGKPQRGAKAPRNAAGAGAGAGGAGGAASLQNSYDVDSAVTRLLSLADEKVGWFCSGGPHGGWAQPPDAPLHNQAGRGG